MIRPVGYDPLLFECSCINPLCSGEENKTARWSCEMMLNYGKIPNRKYMINWPLSGNDYYVNLIEMDPRERADISLELNYTELEAEGPDFHVTI